MEKKLMLEGKQNLHPDTVRGRIQNFIDANAHRIRGDVLEIGALMPHTSAWWCDNKERYGDKCNSWLGIDIQPGQGVDVVHTPSSILAKELLAQCAFDSRDCIICSEVLEHVPDPVRMMCEAHEFLKPGGLLIVTTLFAFPYHAYPNDYFRYSEQGLRYVLEQAGFAPDEIRTHSAGSVTFWLDDHSETGRRFQEIKAPVHTFATAIGK